MNFEDNKELFVEEARELLDSIETNLLALEKEPSRIELINDVFRSLHTIKGSGAMFGYTILADLAHDLESLFDDIRQSKLTITKAITSLALHSLDSLSILVNDDGAELPLQDLRDQIAVLRGKNTISIKEQDKSPISSMEEATDGEENKTTNVYRIYFTPNRDFFHRGARVENLLQELSEKGEIYVSANCDGVPCLEELEPTELYLSWIIVFSSTLTQLEIRSIFIFVEDYINLRIEILPITDQEGRPTVPRIGELLLHRGYLAPEDIDAIRNEQKPFGELAIKSGKIDQEELDAALAEQKMARVASMERESRRESTSIRVRKDKLDYLIDTVGELVILQARLYQEAKKEQLAAFESIAENLARLTANLRDSTMNIRMVPLEESFSGFHRLVHDLGSQLGKELTLTIRGANTEMDKNIIESLKDPLMHIIRNSADHGIEKPEQRDKAGKPRTGTILVEARQQGSKVEIEITDDGAGLDLEKIRAIGIERELIDPSVHDPQLIKNLIFEPGFSTAHKTTGVSGRGVGMDVVRSNIEKLRGDISLESERGQGTRILLSIPLTLVIIDGLLIRVGEVIYVLALNQVEECVNLTLAGEGERRSVISLRGRTIPIIELRRSFKLSVDDRATQRHLVIVDAEGTTVALDVDAVVGKQQVVVKPFTMNLRRVPMVAGATILGDGSIAFILNIRELVKSKRGEEQPLTKERV